MFSSDKISRAFSLFSILLVAILIAALSLPSLAQARLLEKLAVHKLPNGMLILVYPRKISPTFAAQILVDVGSSDEHLDITGIAHMFEHMAFKGTKVIGTTNYAAEEPILEKIELVADEMTKLQFSRNADPGRIAELQKQFAELQKRDRAFVKKDEFSEIYTRNGGQGLNASTGYDFTNYYVSLPNNRLELWMWMESDRLLEPVMREFYVERNVILEERNMRVENSPHGKLWETFMAESFMAHPYGYPVLGWPDDMARLTQSEAISFRKKFYVPANMIAVLVGDLDPQKVFALADRYFGRLPASPNNRITPAEEPEQIGERRFEIRRDANPSLLIAYHKAALPNRMDEVADVASNLLTDGRTSRLYRSLVLEKQLATDVSAFTMPGDKYPNLFTISASPRAPHTVQEVEKAIYAEIARLAKQKPTEHEMQKVKNRLDVDVERSLRSNNGLANLLAYYTGLTRDPFFLEKHIEALKSVTADEVAAFATTILTAKNRTVGWITQEKGEGISKKEEGRIKK